MERTRTNRDKDLGRIVRFFMNRLSGLALVSLRRCLGDHSLRISDRMRKPEAAPFWKRDSCSADVLPVLERAVSGPMALAPAPGDVGPVWSPES